MASIGIIVRANQDLAELGQDWVPQPLGKGADVIAATKRCVSAHDSRRRASNSVKAGAFAVT